MIKTRYTLRPAAVALLAAAAFPSTPLIAQDAVTASPVVTPEPAPAESAPIFQPSVPVVQAIDPGATGPAQVAEQSRDTPRNATPRSSARAPARASTPAPMARTSAPSVVAPAPAPVPTAAAPPPSPLAVPPVVVDPAIAPADPALAPVMEDRAAPWLLGIGLLLLAALGGFAMLMRRRRSDEALVQHEEPVSIEAAPVRAVAVGRQPAVVEERPAPARRTHRLARAAHPKVTAGAAHPVAKSRKHATIAHRRGKASTSSSGKLEHA